MASKIVTFGEIMLRLAPLNQERFVQAGQLKAHFGGGEANVAVSLAQFGHEVWFVTRLPRHLIGDSALNAVRKLNVNAEYILRGGIRLGIYYLENGASIRPSGVIYDRTGSAISEAKSGDFDWENIFTDKDWFHITGITPALSRGCAELTLEAVRQAKTSGLKVSCDLNYRGKLWSREAARETMSNVVGFVDLIIANEEDATDVFGISLERSDVQQGQLDPDDYGSVAKQLMDFSSADRVAITLRESISASENGWSALLYDGENCLTSRRYHIQVVDRVGSGDAFCAGLIHGHCSGWDNQAMIDFATAASALKQTIHGDFNLVSEAEVQKLVDGDLSGRIQR